MTPLTRNQWSSTVLGSDEGIREAYRSDVIETNPLLANRLYMMGLEPWAMYNAGFIRNNLRVWDFAPDDPVNQWNAVNRDPNNTLPSTSGRIPISDVFALRACDTDKDKDVLQRRFRTFDTGMGFDEVIGHAFPLGSPDRYDAADPEDEVFFIRTGDFEKAKPGVFFDQSRPGLLNSQLTVDAQAENPDPDDLFQPFYLLQAQGWPNSGDGFSESAQPPITSLVSGPYGLLLTPDEDTGALKPVWHDVGRNADVCDGWYPWFSAATQDAVDGWVEQGAPEVSFIYHDRLVGNMDLYGGSSGGGVLVNEASTPLNRANRRQKVVAVVNGDHTNNPDPLLGSTWAGPQAQPLVADLSVPPHYWMPDQTDAPPAIGSLITMLTPQTLQWAMRDGGADGTSTVRWLNRERWPQGTPGGDPGPGPCENLSPDGHCARFTRGLQTNRVFGAPPTVDRLQVTVPRSNPDDHVGHEGISPWPDGHDFKHAPLIYHFMCDSEFFRNNAGGNPPEFASAGMAVGVIGSAALFVRRERERPSQPESFYASVGADGSLRNNHHQDVLDPGGTDPLTLNDPIPLDTPIPVYDIGPQGGTTPPDLDALGDLNAGVGVGSVHLVCAPWGSASYTDNWGLLTYIGRALGDTFLHTQESPLERLYGTLKVALVDTFERRWLHAEDRRDPDGETADERRRSVEQTLIRPTSGKLCPPNFYLRGFEVFYSGRSTWTCDEQRQICLRQNLANRRCSVQYEACLQRPGVALVGIKSLICQSNSDLEEQTIRVHLDPDQHMPEEDRTDASPNQYFIPEGGHNPWKEYTFNGRPFSLAQGIGSPSGTAWTMDGPTSINNMHLVNRDVIECENPNEVVSGFGVQSDGSGVINGLWLSCSNAQPPLPPQ